METAPAPRFEQGLAQQQLVSQPHPGLGEIVEGLARALAGCRLRQPPALTSMHSAFCGITRHVSAPFIFLIGQIPHQIIGSNYFKKYCPLPEKLLAQSR
jgi:hypothetical protein